MSGPLFLSADSRRRRLLHGMRRWYAAAGSFQLSAMPESPHSATVRTRFRRLCAGAARQDLRNEIGTEVAGLVIAPLVLLGIAGPAVGATGGAVERILFASGVFAVVFVLLGAVYRLAPGRWTVAVHIGLLAAFLAGAGLIFRLPGNVALRPDLTQRGPGFDGVLLSCLGWGILLMAAILGTALVGAMAATLVQERWVPADVVAFRRVVVLMGIVAAPAHRRAELERRARGARLIGLLADDFQVRMARALAVRDAANDALLREKLHRIASSIRSCQIDMLAPGPDSWADLRALARRTLVVICTGSLGAWPVRPPEPRPRRRTRLAALGRSLRSVVVAVLPLAVLIPLNVLDYLKPVPVARTAMTIGVIWAIVGLLAVVDPLFPARLQATRDIAALFKEPKK